MAPTRGGGAGSPRLRKAAGILLVASLATGGLGQAAVAQSLEESAQVILDWNLNTLGAIRTAEQNPAAANLTMATVHAAIFDAVNAITGGYASYNGPLSATPDASPVAAAAAAAHGVLAGTFPDQAATFDPLLEASLAEVPDGDAETAGVAVGEAAAAAMLAAREGDGRGVANPISTGTEPGVYRPTPPDLGEFPGSWIAKVKPFLVDSASDYRTAGPHALESEAYAAEYEEVLTLGGAEGSGRMPEQDAVAAFWTGPTPQFSAVERSLTTEMGLGITEAARLFAIANLAAADAVIGCFDDKYYWMFWRPVTAIHEAEADGNPATAEHDEWMPLVGNNPPYPDHPSGFNCVAGAHVGALRGVLGTDEVAFAVPSIAEGGEPRSYTTLTQAMDEVIDARIYQGLHFRAAEVQGAQLGQRAAELALERLAPID
jgi:hypothetical protein